MVPFHFGLCRGPFFYAKELNLWVVEFVCDVMHMAKKEEKKDNYAKIKWGLTAKPLQNRKWCLFKIICTRTMYQITYLLTMLLYIHTVFSKSKKKPVFVNCVTVLAL